MRHLKITGLVALLLAPASLTLADGHASQGQMDKAVKARQMHMQLYAFNLGILGDMAKGEAAYDAGAAGAAAAALAALAAVPQNNYWIVGTDSGNHPTSRAKPEIWGDGSTAAAKAEAFAEAAMAMEQVAGVDLASMQGAIGPVGAACGACHDDYRGPRR